MLTIAHIAERYGLTERQVRWRLTQLGSLLHHHVFNGVNGRVTLDDAGLTIVDRLIQLEREGLGLSTAVNRLAREIGQAPTATPVNPGVNGASPSVNGSVELWERLISEKDARIADLQAERERLLKLLEDLQARIPALPAPSETRRSWWGRLWGR